MGAAIGSDRRIVVVIHILRDVVAGHVEAGGVGQVEDIQRVAQLDALAEGRYLDSEMSARLLRGLAEDVALAVVDEVGFIGIVGGNRAVADRRD